MRHKLLLRWGVICIKIKNTVEWKKVVGMGIEEYVRTWRGHFMKKNGRCRTVRRKIY